MKVILYLFIISLVFLSAPSEAKIGLPFVEKKGTITAPNQSPLILEILNGYKFNNKPEHAVKLQIRNAYGTLIASSPQETHNAFFCPHVNFCWTYPYSQGSLWTTGYALDENQIDYNKKFTKEISDETNGQNIQKEFKNYLSDDKTVLFSGSLFLNKEMDSPQITGFSTSLIATAISPVFIIADNFLFYLFLTALMFLIIKTCLIFKKAKTKENKIPSTLMNIISVLMLLALGLTCCAITLLGIFIFYIPVFFIALSLACGVYLGRKNIQFRLVAKIAAN